MGDEFYLLGCEMDHIAGYRECFLDCLCLKASMYLTPIPYYKSRYA